MPKRLLAVVWQHLPIPLRRLVILLSHATYTVGASAVVVDHQGRVLLLRHRLREDTGWELPGGFVGRGEQPEDAIARELREETSLEIEVTHVLSARVAKWRHLDVCFLARLSGGVLTLDRAEISDAYFFGFDELPAGFSPQQRASVDAARAVFRTSARTAL